MSAPGPDTLLAVDGVHFGYGRRPVLRGAALEVERGELVALLGTNGSGKTTLLRLIAGTLTPDAGEVRFDGRAVVEWRRAALARRVAVLPQSARARSALVGFRSTSVSRSTTTGVSSAPTPSWRSRASAPPSLSRSTNRWGSRFRAANSSSRLVSWE